jgi:2-amino-4-hydroxy-6-hydroxymethyldihydropteridine diphosphokinase
LDYFIGLGSNLGDRLATIDAAVAQLADLGLVTQRSSIWETPPMYVSEQPAFLNGIVVLRSDLSPAELMTGLLRIEESLGRVRAERYGPRTIDLDIVAAGDTVLKSDFVEIPHPRLEERAFVVIPLIEVAGDWRNPATSHTLGSLPVASTELRCVAPRLTAPATQ